MKVFLSWSGDRSHKVALTFRDWLPSVVQSIEPYVSSEDIDKGARWSTDIAKELENSTYGILCVTKQNIDAPWLNFEAGALSKTMEKTFVSPFLFDIKRSEVSGPILQFQSTIFQKEDIKKLLVSLNKACPADQLSDERLDKAFEVWYPTLEQQLNNLLEKTSSENVSVEENEKGILVSTGEILEEILDISSNNQKLLRNPEGELKSELQELKYLLQKSQTKNQERMIMKRRRKLHPLFIEELLHISSRFEKDLTGFQITLSLFRNEFPWLHDAGLDLVRLLKSEASHSDRVAAIRAFEELIEFTFMHPIMRDMYPPDEEMWMIGRELPNILHKVLRHYCE